MAATVQLVESNGPASSRVDTANPDNLNLLGSDRPNVDIDPADYPLVLPPSGSWAYSYAKWIRLRVTDMGGSSVLDNFKVWKSAGSPTGSGETLRTNYSEGDPYFAPSYPVGGPSNNMSAAEPIVDTEPTGPTIGIGGSLSGQITQVNQFTDYIVFQLYYPHDLPVGPSTTKTITFQWDER